MFFSYCKTNEDGKKVDKRESNLFMLPWQPGCYAADNYFIKCNLDRLLYKNYTNR